MDISQLDKPQVKETTYKRAKDIRTRVSKLEARISTLEQLVLSLDANIGQLIRRIQNIEKS